MRALFVLIAVLTLSGCYALRDAGTARYRIRPYVDGQGATQCCEVLVENGKEMASLEASFIRRADGSCELTLRETGVQAFEGQRAAAESMRGIIAETVTSAVKAAITGGL